MILNISLQRPEVIKKENQLHHKTKEIKDLSSPESCYRQAFEALPCWPQGPALSTLCVKVASPYWDRGSFWYHMMCLKPLREHQEASLSTPTVYKDRKRAVIVYPPEVWETSLMGHLLSCLVPESKEEEETYQLDPEILHSTSLVSSSKPQGSALSQCLI